MSIALKILKWFDSKGRKDLPWQKNPSLYRVWVSEIMLQQTQVSTVIPYFERFMQKFPELSHLAKAPIDAVLKEWTGLGYYARARNLHKTAGIILEKYKGQFPQDYESVLQLPGIGRSTAGAILAICTGQHYAILDGNVKRVLSRLFAVSGWPSLPRVTEKLWEYSEQITPKKRVNHFTQAIMDLGAMVCTRTKPNCTACPLSNDCLAKAEGKETFYPNSKPKKIKPSQTVNLIMLLHPEKNAVLLEKRPEKGIWGGLWSFPECKEIKHIKNCLDKDLNLNIQSKKALTPFRHTFTHYHLDIQPILCRVKVSKHSEKKKVKEAREIKTTRKTRETRETRATRETKKTSQYYWQRINTPITKGVSAPVKRLLEQLENI